MYIADILINNRCKYNVWLKANAFENTIKII